jgi:hypothetical protein
MRPLKSIVLLIVVDNIGDGFLLIETTLVDGILGEIGLDDIELAEMPSAVTIIADAILVIVMVEVSTGQLGGSSIEDVSVVDAVFVIMLAPLGLDEVTGVYR